MNIIILGAAGDVGQRIVKEALARGHEVTAVIRKDAQRANLPARARYCVADVSNPQQLAQAIEGQDVIISAVRPPDGQEQALVTLTRSILDCTQENQRVLLVGGAARLFVPGQTGKTVLTAPDFLPATAVAIAQACQSQYELCLTETRAQWTYLSPAAMLSPGERTGHYRTGTDTLIISEKGVSHISMEDFAVAMLDEVENEQHLRRAFTVGY